MKMTVFLTVLSFVCSAAAVTTRLEDRSSVPSRSAAEVEKVAAFDFPPGHVTISRTGRFFIDHYTADAKSGPQVIELVGDEKIPFPSALLQRKFNSIHGIYVDGADRLWILDHDYCGFMGAPHLYGYDINTGAEIVDYAFPRAVAGYGSMVNDLVVDLRRQKIYISDTSPIAKTSAIVVFDIATRTSRRVLHDHPSLRVTTNGIFVEGKPFTIFGVFKPKFGLDGIALDPAGEFFYYASFNGGKLNRVPVAALVDETLSAQALSDAVEDVASITMTDGIFMDADHRTYLSDVEHSAIVRLSPGGELETLYRDPAFSWPTGFAPSPDGWIYFTCNAIQDTKLRTRAAVLKRGPFFLYRFRP